MRKFKFYHHSLAILSSTVVALEIQIWALVRLPPDQFGAISLTFLAIALMTSVTYSALCEPWQIGKSKEPWEVYSSVLTLVSFCSALVTCLMALAVPAAMDTLLVLLVISFFTIFRFGSRYFAVRSNDFRSILVPDLAYIVIVSSGILLEVSGWIDGGLNTIYLVWALAIASTFFASRMPNIQIVSSINIWRKQHSNVIKPLLFDSSLLDLAGIGTPIILLPVLGLSNFGIYRGISNLTSPVKIVLTSMRPYFGNIHKSFITGFKGILLVFSLGAVPGVLTFVLLYLLESSEIAIGTLSALSEYKIQVALVTVFTFVNGVYYLFSRMNINGKSLIIARTLNILFGISLPLLGGLLGGILWAINCFVISNLIFIFIWIVFVYLSNDGIKSESGANK